MGIAKEYMSGNAHIVIYDDYCVKTQEEINEILDRVAEIYDDYFARDLLAQEKKKSRPFLAGGEHRTGMSEKELSP